MKVKFLRDAEGFEVGEVVFIPDEKLVESLVKSEVVEILPEGESPKAPAKAKKAKP